MSAVELIRCPQLASAEYAYAAVVATNHLVLTAGACPLDGDGVVVAPGNVTRQAEQVMTNLESALHAAGVGLADVVKTTVYVASAERADLVAAWRVVRACFADHDPPSTLLGVAALGYPGQLVEVEASAAVAPR